MIGHVHKLLKFSLSDKIIVSSALLTLIGLSTLLTLIGCGDSNERPMKVWTEVHKEYPDGTVIKWEIKGAASVKNGCISWIKNNQEEVCVCGSISVIIHRDPIEVLAKATDNEKDEAKEGGKEKKEESK